MEKESSKSIKERVLDIQKREEEGLKVLEGVMQDIGKIRGAKLRDVSEMAF